MYFKMKEKLPYPKEINERVNNGMGCYSQIGEGWFNIVRELDKKISELCPDYVVDQVKEKFGELRYYVNNISTENREKVKNLIQEAREKSQKTCDMCGKKGKLYSHLGFLATRCEKHKDIHPSIDI